MDFICVKIKNVIIINIVVDANMEDNKIIELLEGLDIPQEKIDEIMVGVRSLEENPPKNGDKVGDAEISIGNLKEQLETETDWRKRASIAAKIISLGLE